MLGQEEFRTWSVRLLVGPGQYDNWSVFKKYVLA